MPQILMRAQFNSLWGGIGGSGLSNRARSVILHKDVCFQAGGEAFTSFSPNLRQLLASLERCRVEDFLEI